MAMNLKSSSGGRRSRRGGRRAPMADINVTPLVDVMLVLLIIFMVTAPLLVSGVPVDLPTSRAKQIELPEAPLDVTVDTEGAVFIDGEAVRPSELAAKLEAIAAEQTPDNPRKIMLRGDTSVDYGSMMKVMGELNRAGLNSVNMVTQGASAPTPVSQNPVSEGSATDE
jgi:biopolymer transport protein TolR